MKPDTSEASALNLSGILGNRLNRGESYVDAEQKPEEMMFLQSTAGVLFVLLKCTPLKGPFRVQHLGPNLLHQLGTSFITTLARILERCF